MILATNTTEAQFATWLIAIMCKPYGSSILIWIVIPHHLTDPSTHVQNWRKCMDYSV